MKTREYTYSQIQKISSLYYRNGLGPSRFSSLSPRLISYSKDEIARFIVVPTLIDMYHSGQKWAKESGFVDSTRRFYDSTKTGKRK